MVRIAGFGLLVLLLFSCSKTIENKQQSSTRDSLGIYYYKLGKKFAKENKLDTAYYYYHQAEKKFVKNKDSFSLAKVYLSKAIVEYMFHDLPTSESYCVKALQYLPEKNKNYQKSIYNILAVVAMEKKEYTTAMEYLNKYKNIYKNEKDTLFNFIAYHNNISNAYRNQKQYQKALTHLDSILSIREIKNKYPKKLARALDNKAHILTKINQLENVPKLLDSAYRIRHKINDAIGLIQSHLNYARYYRKIHKKNSARHHALLALKLSTDNKIAKNQLDSYENLVKLSLPESNDYFEKYLQLNDSIQFEQEKAKGQTARIHFESVEKEKKIEAQQQIIMRNKIRLRWFLLLLLIVSTASVIFALQLRKIRKQHQIIDLQNEQLKKQNNKIQNIYKDMHHRIKNNLRTIHQNFIEPVMKNIENPEMLEILSKLRKNIISLKKLHMILLDNDASMDVPLAQMVNKAIVHIEDTLPAHTININKQIDEDIRVPYKQAFPIILIINEFITNSYKHAFENTPEPHIDISITQIEKDIKFIIKDNGKGLPEDLDLSQLKSHGLNLIFSLITELKGKLQYRNNPGLEFEISFPKQL